MNSLEHSIDLSWTENFERARTCAVNIRVVKSVQVRAEVAPGDFQVVANEDEVIAEAGHEENPIEPLEFSFDDVRSRRIYSLCDQLMNSCHVLHPITKQFLVDHLVDCGMKLASLRPENDVDCGYEIKALVRVSYFRAADEEEIALLRQLDEMDDEEDMEDAYDDMDDDVMEDMDEANPSFRGVEEGRYDGGEGKEVITCSVCLEDLSSGMEFKKLPCSHVFHSTCIDHWLKRNASCPNCRSKLEEQGLMCSGGGTYVWYTSPSGSANTYSSFI